MKQIIQTLSPAGRVADPEEIPTGARSIPNRDGVRASVGNGDIIRNLIDVGTGKIPHRYMGLCPDAVDGHEQRDKDCPACRILIRAAAASCEMNAKAQATTPASTNDDHANKQ